MKKRNIYTLELDDEEPMSDVAQLLFRTSQPGYLFADILNRLYGYSLRRIDDMPLDGAEWPFYTYADGVNHLRYYLVEKPAGDKLNDAWGEHNKMLVIKGECAEEEAERLYEDLTDPMPADEGDLLATEHAALRDDLMADFLLVDRYDPSVELPPKASRRMTQIQSTLKQHSTSIMTHIDTERLDLV